MTIAVASFKMKILTGEGGLVVRKLTYDSCYLKGRRVGIYGQMLIDGNTVETDAIIWTLLYLQALGAIKCALDVYEGREELNVDSTIYESSEVLQAKLRKAENTLNTKQQVALMNPADNDTIPNHLWDELIKNHDDDDLISMLVTCHQTTREVSSKRMAMGTANALLSDFARRYGYLPSSKFFFGSTGTRKNFQVDSRNSLQSTSYDTSAHLNIHANHSGQVALDHYEDEDAIKRNFPANLLRSSVGEAEAKIVLDNVEAHALFDIAGFFRPDWRKRLDALPPHKDFMIRYGSSPKFLGKCDCPVADCNQTFRFVSDLHDHVNQTHKGKKGKEKVTCPSCDEIFEVGNYKSNHINPNSKTPCKGKHELNPLINRETKRSKDLGPPDGVWVFTCDECTWWGYRQSDLNKHKQTTGSCKKTRAIAKKKEEAQEGKVNPNLTDSTASAKSPPISDENDDGPDNGAGMDDNGVRMGGWLFASPPKTKRAQCDAGNPDLNDDPRAGAIPRREPTFASKGKVDSDDVSHSKSFLTHLLCEEDLDSKPAAKGKVDSDDDSWSVVKSKKAKGKGKAKGKAKGRMDSEDESWSNSKPPAKGKKVKGKKGRGKGKEKLYSGVHPNPYRYPVADSPTHVENSVNEHLYMEAEPDKHGGTPVFDNDAPDERAWI
jgi:hypothetical protein